MFVPTTSTSSTLNEPNFDLSQQSRSTMRNLEASQATSCYSACSSCSPRHMPRSVSNPSRHSTTPIICSFHSSSPCTPMRWVVSFVTASNPFHPSQENLSGLTASGTRAGDGSCLAEESIWSNASTARSNLADLPRSPKSFAIHTMRSRSSSQSPT